MASLALMLSACILLLASARAIRHSLTKTRHVPSMGSVVPILSYLEAIRFLVDAPTILCQGYAKYRGNVFRIAQLNGWLYIVSGSKLTEELCRAPESILSPVAALNELLQTRYTIRADLDSLLCNLRSLLLRRNFSTEVANETLNVLGELLPRREEWGVVPIYQIIEEVLYRASNRLVVGETLCRNTEYISLSKSYTAAVLRSALVFNALPEFLKPFVGWFFDPITPIVARGTRLLESEFEVRASNIAQYGTAWPGIEDDILAGLISKYDDISCCRRDVTLQVLTVTLAAVHTTSQSFMHALYYIAMHPEHTEVLRQETESLVHSGGWQQSTLVKMRKLDSFLRESLRLRSLGALSLAKIAQRDFVFSDGTTIPRGSVIAAPALAIHSDEENYDHATSFKPWRFLAKDPDGSDGAAGSHITVTSSKYLAFGHGKHACPGRFFASLELKLILAYILRNYDVKLESASCIPNPTWYVVACTPDPSVRVLFRKRQET